MATPTRRRKKKTANMLLIFILVLTLILAAAVILLIHLSQGEVTPDPTTPPTQAPTDAPTDAPTQAPTDAPTDPPTDPPTEAPTVPEEIGSGANAAVFHLNDGTDGVYTTVRFEDEARIANPGTPVRDGYFFKGWYKDAECTQAFNFNERQ